MTQQMKPIKLNILGKEYMVACAPEERVDLMNTAHMLDEQMREIQDAGKVIGADRIAVMAALNLAHELNQIQKQNAVISKRFTEHMVNLRQKIENVLHNGY